MSKKWGKCDFSELVDLQKRLDKALNGDTVLFYEACARELAARLLRKVIKRTPVGDNQYEIRSVDGKEKKYVIKNGGTLRRGWTSKTEKEAESGVEKNAFEWANSLKVQKNSGVYTIEVINPVTYASYVEYGHRQEPGRYVPAIGKRLVNSWVDGVFMLTISSEELEAEMPRILEAKIIKFLEECFNG